MKQTNLNHWVPQFTSRPWLLGRDHFIRLSLSDASVVADRVGPKNFGSEANLYSQEVEDSFSYIEAKLSAIQRRLGAGDRLSEDERNAWAMWLLASYLRTPQALLNNAEANQVTGTFHGEIVPTGCSWLVQLTTNADCVAMITHRQWEVLHANAPLWLKPDTGLVLTDRLDAKGCLIIYPLSPHVCFLASGHGTAQVSAKADFRRAAGINQHILRWAERSVACTAQHWARRRGDLEAAVKADLGQGRYRHPKNGKFFAVEARECDGKLELMLLAPRGPVVMTAPKGTLQPVVHQRPKIGGLYEAIDAPEMTLKVRLSDNENEIHFTSAALFAREHGRTDLALDFAKKALARNPEDLIAKLVILAIEPNASVGDLTPHSPDEALEFAHWLCNVKKVPLEALKLTSSWLKQYPEHHRLIGANFLCAFLVYGGRLFQFLAGGSENLPYIDDSTPLPDGIIELLEKAFHQGKGGLVEKFQLDLAGIDHQETGLTADILRICGCHSRLRLHRVPDEAPFGT
jgi:hypothetical protein